MIGKMELRSLVLGVSLALFGAGGHAFANDPVPEAELSAKPIDQKRLAAARELMRVSDAEKQFEQTIPLALGQSFEAMIPYFEKLSPDDEKAQFQTFMKSYAAEMSAQMTARRGEFIELSAAIHARVYTLDELEAMTVFYGTPAGIKYNSTGPQVMTDVMPALMQILMGENLTARQTAPGKLAAAREMIRSGGIADMLLGDDLTSVFAQYYGRVASTRGLAAGEVVEELQFLRELLTRNLAPVLAAMRARQGMAIMLRLNRVIDKGIAVAVVGYTDALVATLFAQNGVPTSGAEYDPTEVERQLDALERELSSLIKQPQR
jgi:hypothetical protein